MCERFDFGGCCSFSKRLLISPIQLLPRCHLKHGIWVYTILLVFFVFSCFNVRAVEPQTVTPLADTYVEISSISSTHGQEEYLKISETSTDLSITFLMFDLSGVSYDSDVPFEAKLRLRSLYVTLPINISVRWCGNNTWDEDTLTFLNYNPLCALATKPHILQIFAESVWYEWTVTGFVSTAIRENYEKITLVLEVEESVEENALALFYSKDQQDLPPNECIPQLVFTYPDHGGVSLDIIGKVILGLLATVGIVFVAYRFLKNPAKKRRRSSSVRYR